MASKMKHKGLVNHLKRWGLKVEVNNGWRTAGRPYNFYPRAIAIHHTASNRNSGNFGALGIVTNGRVGLPGPLSQFMLGRDGTVRIIAAGYANHAGYGGPIAGIPANMGNTYSIGIEAENDGVGEPWGNAQLNAYYRLCAALLVWMGTKDVNKVFGHKEWTSRKIDPAGIDMNQFRREVQKAINAGPTVKTVNLKRLKPGKRNAQVVWLKRRLKRRGYYKAGNMTNYYGKGVIVAVKRMQSDLGVTNPDGVPGKRLLNKLGFRVRK